jgi:CHAT domain-containing protein
MRRRIRRERVFAHAADRNPPVSLPEHPVFWAGFALLGEP